LFAFTAVSNVLGTINPITDLCRKAKSLGVTTFIDAAQAAPHEPIDVQAIGCDFLAFSGHKLLGPTGIGALYGREELLETMPPFLGGGNMIRTVTPETFTTAMLPAKFEAGTPAIVEAFGLTAAIDYIEQLGLENIRAHEQRLAAAAHRGLAELGGIRFLGPSPEKKAGIVSFVVEGGHPSDVNMVLDHRGVAIRIGHHCTMPLHQRLGVQISNRASFYIYNTEDDVAQLVEAVRDAKKKLRLP
jgi:cysteine desulfurase/selenocysteine lyase